MWHIVLITVLCVLAVSVWILTAWVAGVVAPDDRTMTFFWLTLFFGPLGVLAAAVASPRDPRYLGNESRSIAKGRTRYRCARCGAASDLHEPKGFTCWRCSENKYLADS